jgi:hypothetical protein
MSGADQAGQGDAGQGHRPGPEIYGLGDAHAHSPEQLTRAGLTRPQAIDSSIPLAMGPQAAVCPVSTAAWRSGPEAEAQRVVPLNVTQTSQVICCVPRVE